MAMQYAPRYFTGFTIEQQIEFRNCLNDRMLLIASIDGVPLGEDFPLLWAPMLRENQLEEGYDHRTDRVYLLSHCPPAQWRPILYALSQRWALQHQHQLVAQYQTQIHGHHMAPGQPEIPGYTYPQQIQMRECNVAVGHSHVPRDYTRPQHDAMSVESIQGAGMSFADSSFPAVDPSLASALQQEESDLEAVRAAATQAVAEQDLSSQGLDDAPNPCHTTNEPEELYTVSADADTSWGDVSAQEISVEAILAVEI
jgi:hypothetical protein